MNEEQLPPGNSNFTAAILPDRMALYMSEVAEIDATEQQKLELLSVIYSIMRSFVELGFDAGAIDVWQSIATANFNEAGADTLQGAEETVDE